jgi:thiamine biosynthesis lipoprotein
MGTTYSVTISDHLTKTSLSDIEKQIGDELERIEQIFSLFRPNSELSCFNRAQSAEWIEVSDDLLSVTKCALELAHETSSAFDPTIAPLVRLWRLRQVNNDWSPPTTAAIAEARKRVDFRQLEIRRDPPGIRKRMTGLEIDLNALVEGWAIDRVITLLQQNGISGALVELGGEFRAMGLKPERQPWKIGIEKPLEPRSLHAIASLSDAALATSGNYRQAIEFRGRRYGHILDGRTGAPVQHNLLSVSVIADDALTADGWATALMVLGPIEGFALAEKKGMCASFAMRAGDQLQIKRTKTALGQIMLADK